ncbi:MAG: ATP-grasp fold amidoligase family protein [Pseudomonadota bacterium]
MFAEKPPRQSIPTFDPKCRWLNLRAYAANRHALKPFKRMVGYWPNIAFPLTYHEKMFWRRVYDHDPFFELCCDKHGSKALFEALDDPIPAPKTLWIGDRPEDFPDDLMCPGVIAKMTAGCAQNWFFEQQGVDRRAFDAIFRKWLSKPYGQRQSQWGYRNAPRRLMAEEAVAPGSLDIEELKFHCHNGKVHHITAYRGEKTEFGQSAIFSPDGVRQNVFNTIAKDDPTRRLPNDYQLPTCYERASAAAQTLSVGRDYLRIDFMVTGGRLWAGEVTAYPSAGLMGASDARLIRSLANNWDMRLSWFVRTPQKGRLEAYRQQLLEFVETNGPPISALP